MVLVAAAATQLEAQKLETGTWTGTISDPDGESFSISFEVQNTSDTLAVTMVGPGGERMAFSNIRFDEGKLLFTWEPGVAINCALSPVERGGYSGPCTDEEGKTGQITMTPPAKQN